MASDEGWQGRSGPSLQVWLQRFVDDFCRSVQNKPGEGCCPYCTTTGHSPSCTDQQCPGHHRPGASGTFHHLLQAILEKPVPER